MTDENELNGTADEETPKESSGEQQVDEQDAAKDSGEAEMTEIPEADSGVDSSEESDSASEESVSSEEDFDKIVNENDAPEDEAEAAMLAMLEDLPSDESKADVSEINFPDQEVSNVQFQHLSEPAGKGESRNIDMLMDVNLPISIELGRTKMTISEILSLGPGSVVELNKLAGEPVDVLVNQRIVAKGEVVVIDENFGVRVTQLMTPEERLKALGEEH